MDIDPGFSTRESRQIFGQAARLRRLLETEAALALASSEVNLVPRSAADIIARVCEQEAFDAETIFANGWRAGTPLIPLVAELRQRVGPQAAGFVHLGATSQDILDTGAMLQTRTGLAVAQRNLLGIADTLARLVTSHRATAMVGRTLMQPAGGTTFGSKAAGWLDAILVNIERVRTVTGELPVQLGGLIGDRETLSGNGQTIAESMALRLGLALPQRSWHTRREPVADAAHAMAAATRTVAKIANDLILLAQAEVGEVAMRAGGSSSRSEKRNPIDAVRTRAAAQLALAQTAALLTLPPYEHERAAGAWQAEWALVPILFHAALAAFEGLTEALTSLRVDTQQMASNLSTKSFPEHTPTDRERMIDQVLAAYERLVS